MLWLQGKKGSLDESIFGKLVIPGRAEAESAESGCLRTRAELSRWKRSRSRDRLQDEEMNISEDRPKVGAIQNRRRGVSTKQQGRLYLPPRFYPSWREWGPLNKRHSWLLTLTIRLLKQ